MNMSMCVSGIIVIIMIMLMVLTAHMANRGSSDGVIGFGLFFAVEFFIAIIAGAVFLIALFMKMFQP